MPKIASQFNPLFLQHACIYISTKTTLLNNTLMFDPRKYHDIRGFRGLSYPYPYCRYPSLLPVPVGRNSLLPVPVGRNIKSNQFSKSNASEVKTPNTAKLTTNDRLDF